MSNGHDADADLGAALHTARADRGRLPGGARAAGREGLRRRGAGRVRLRSRRPTAPHGRSTMPGSWSRARTSGSQTRPSSQPHSTRTKRSDATLVVIPMLSHKAFADVDSVRATADRVNALDAVARERGMTLGYHNHFWEFAHDARRPAGAVASLRPPRAERCSPRSTSTGRRWPARIPKDLVTELGSRVGLLHVKDGPADEPPSSMVAVGDGAVDVPACSKRARVRSGTSSSSIGARPTCSKRLIAATTISSVTGSRGAARERTGEPSRDRRLRCDQPRLRPHDAQARLHRARGVRRRSSRTSRGARRPSSVRSASTLDAVLDDPTIDAVVNLTPPLAHAAVDRRGARRGQGGIQREAARRRASRRAPRSSISRPTRACGSGAPPTRFSAPGCKPSRAVIDRGDIGEPLAANAFMLGSGPECVAPEPGALLPTRRGPPASTWVPTTSPRSCNSSDPRARSARRRVSRAPQRPILSEPLRGELIDVEVPTHVGALVEFESGPIATLVTSFDVQASRYRNIEVYGTEATLSVPDPNTFGGPVMIKRNGDEQWTEIDLLPAHLPQQRGIGLADMMWAQRSGRAASDVERVGASCARADDRRAQPRPRAGASICRRPATGRRRCRSVWPPNTFDD